MDTRVRTRSAALRWASVLLAAMAVTGCQQAGDLISQLADRPTVSLRGVRVQGLSADSAELVFDADVNNPYPVALPVTDAQYALATTGEPFLTGQADLAGTVPAGGSRTFSLPVSVSFGRLLSASRQLKAGQVVDYVAHLTLRVDAPRAGAIELPLRKRGKLPIPAVPEVAVESVGLETMSLTEVAGRLRLRVGNTNSFPVDLSSLRYALSLAGQEVARATVSQPTSFQVGQRKTLTIPLSFSPARLGRAGLSALSGAKADYRVGGTMSLATPYGPLDMPFERTGTAPLRK